MNKLILGCGIGRCGTGFLSYFMFLNPKVAVWDGPGMGELFSHVAKGDNLPLEGLHDVWGDDYQEPTHGLKNNLGEWAGSKDFEWYYRQRLKERRNSSVYFISHVLGERWYPTYQRHFKCNITIVYCAREIISHYRSFKRWYHIDGFTAKEFLGRIRESLTQIDGALNDGTPVVCINVPDYSMLDVRKKMKQVLSKIDLPISKEQTLFLSKRRKLGPSKAPLDASDTDLLKELQQVPDFDNLKSKYDALRTGRYEA